LAGSATEATDEDEEESGIQEMEAEIESEERKRSRPEGMGEGPKIEGLRQEPPREECRSKPHGLLQVDEIV
jgi:hypothetical protein